MIRIGIVGRLELIKNHKMFLDVAVELLYRFDGKEKLKFIIVGDGGEYFKIKMNSIERNIPLKFLGWKKDMVEVYKNIDILLCTSNNEGTPVSIIEAIVSGIPVISTNVGGIKDVFEMLREEVKTKEFFPCVLVGVGDVIEMSNEVERAIIFFKEYKILSQLLRKVCYNIYRKEKLIENINNLYLSKGDLLCVE